MTELGFRLLRYCDEQIYCEEALNQIVRIVKASGT